MAKKTPAAMLREWDRLRNVKWNYKDMRCGEPTCKYCDECDDKNEGCWWMTNEITERLERFEMNVRGLCPKCSKSGCRPAEVIVDGEITECTKHRLY
jgi:hypothetical protein